MFRKVPVNEKIILTSWIKYIILFALTTDTLDQGLLGRFC